MPPLLNENEKPHKRSVLSSRGIIGLLYTTSVPRTSKRVTQYFVSQISVCNYCMGTRVQLRNIFFSK